MYSVCTYGAGIKFAEETAARQACRLAGTGEAGREEQKTELNKPSLSPIVSAIIKAVQRPLA